MNDNMMVASPSLVAHRVRQFRMSPSAATAVFLRSAAAARTRRSVTTYSMHATASTRVGAPSVPVLRIGETDIPSHLTCSNIRATSTLASASRLPETPWLIHNSCTDFAGTTRSLPQYANFINGEYLPSESTEFIDVTDPATNTLLAQVPQSSRDEMQMATQAAKSAFTNWRAVPVQHRQRIMLKLQALIRDNHDELAYLITAEQGKTFADARGDVFRGLEVVESACNVGGLLMGETLGGLADGLDCVTFRHPLGVCAGTYVF